ncbi:MAG: hypothetical protein F2574_02660 [Actinobacteria bacterium]|nr:hypothetical protein [Actinomycetota bacterium]
MTIVRAFGAASKTHHDVETPSIVALSRDDSLADISAEYGYGTITLVV